MITPHVAYVETCRACSTGYNFKIRDGVVVTVICGIPPTTSSYKAVSYLWEMEDGVKVCLVCHKCEARKVVPVRNAAKLWRIMKFVSGGGQSCRIWLDALSIDQDDPKDLNKQLKVMGNIYRHAGVVSVLFPAGDEVAYEMLRKLAVVAQAIVDNEKSGKFSSGENTEELEGLSDSFLDLMKDWASNLEKWRYWSRAWTFQEWAMAVELEVTCELAAHKEILCDIKNIIVMAASILGHWKNTRARSSGLDSRTLPDILRIRAETGAFLNEVRLHFPLSDAFIADNELEGDALREYTFASPQSAIDSGTYITPVSPKIKELSPQKTLTEALNAFTTSRREAGYEADLVACWASMCKIKYDYKNSDTVNEALHKVLTSLRKNGLRIFNFQVNTSGGESDLEFMKYAAAMRQSNSKSKGFMFGSPTFTGRVDTITHLRLCLADREIHELERYFNVKLQGISNASVMEILPLSDKEGVISAFRPLVSGTIDGDKIQDVMLFVEELLDNLKTEQLQSHVLATVSIGVKDEATMTSFNAWAICPAKLDAARFFVARESLNGTLVIATSESTSTTSETARIVAYFNMTHQRDGTYLIKSDRWGTVDIVFRALEDPLFDSQWMADLTAGMGLDFLDLGTLDSMNDRMLNVKIGLQTTGIIAALSWIADTGKLGYQWAVTWVLWLKWKYRNVGRVRLE